MTIRCYVSRVIKKKPIKKEIKKKRQYRIIHCSATPNNKEFTGQDIVNWHTWPKPKGNGWKQVGYELVIRRDGTVDRLVDDNGDNLVDPSEITNGAQGINSISSHVCLIGGYDAKGDPNLEMTKEQHNALVGIIKDDIVRQQDIKIAGHYHFSTKTCPNFDVENWLKEIGVSKENIYKKKMRS